MKNKTVKALALAMAVATVTMMGSASIYASDDTAEAATEETADTEEDADDDQAAADEVTTLSDTSDDTADTAEASDDDQKAADEVAALIDKIYVQERNDTTDEDCKAAKEAWDKLTDAQKALVEGEEASPEYFGADTGDASKDDPRNQDEIGENELLVVSFGTSFNDSRAQDIKGIEDKLQEAYPDWSVRRAFTAQIIINHVQARDNEKIDNVDQALQRAVDNGVKNLIIQPTHLMHGAEYDELVGELEAYKDKFEKVVVAEPLLGEVGADATEINADKKVVAEDITAEAVKTAGYDSLDAAKEDSTAFVFMGHGTSHTAKVSYSQMSAQMQQLGYDNVFIGTVEGEPEDTECQAVIEKVKEEVPGIVLENCASGGHRLEPKMMSVMSMASFSDAHECEEIPIIAANLHRVIHPTQSQIWAVIRQDDSLKRIAYSISNTFLGRMCISGDVTQLAPEKWNLIEQGISFYGKIKDIIKEGQSYRYGPKIKSARHPEGWQALLRVGKNKQAYVVIHVFDGKLPEVIEIELPEDAPDHIRQIYAHQEMEVSIKDRKIYYRPSENKSAVTLWLE